MRRLGKTYRYVVRLYQLLTPGLVLAAGLLASKTLYAQGANALRSATFLSTSSSATSSDSSLPDAPGAIADHHRVATDVQSPLFPSDPQANDRNYTYPHSQQRERSFLLNLIGPTAFIAPAFEAGIDTIRPLKVGYPSDGFMAPGNHPGHGDVPEWGEGAQGYAKRYADRFGQGLVGTTSRYALGEILREDVTYHRCQCTGLLPRTAHALLGAYTAHTRSGRAIPSLPAVASPLIASEVAVAAWYPSRYTDSDALRISVLNYVAAPFKNLFVEFIAK